MDRIDLVEQEILDYSAQLLDILLSDKTTGGNIRWATNDYADHGPKYLENMEIKPELITGSKTTLIQPRAAKSLAERQKRTRDKAEVFTPLWVCNAQNNLIDEAWFGRSDVFNIAEGTFWKPNNEPVSFDKEHTWASYVKKNVLEMACGEAPYLVSRYDPVTGEKIPLHCRIGLLDRKFRVVGENTSTEQSWSTWAMKAFQSTYGFDFQGDNVLLARENLLATYIEYFFEKFGHAPKLARTKEFANVIAWNIWQMDGINCSAPFASSPLPPSYIQESLFEIEPSSPIEKKNDLPLLCKIYDWQEKKAIEYASLLRKGQ